MDQLPPEIVAVIFSKATLKTLIQCRRVCKSWLAVLSDPAILRSHLKLPKCLLLHINPNDTTNSRFLYLYNHRDITSPDDNAVLKLAAKTNDPNWVTTELVGFSNGMLCWCRKVPTGEDYQFRVTIYISNPLTGESMTIPSGTDYYNQCSRIGFGFTPNKKQYKLVHLAPKTHRTRELEAKVQTLGSGIWKCVKCPYKVRPRFGVYANGALHWVDNHGKICFFDLETEQFGTLPSPPSPHPLGGIAVIKDWITVWCKVDYPTRRVQTWMMMEYGVESSWLEFKARGFDFDTRLERGVKLEYERPLIFYPKRSLILCSPKRSWSLYSDQYHVQQLYVYEHERTYSLVAMPFGSIDEALSGFVPTFLPMETLLKGS